MSTLLYRLGKWSALHKKTVLVGWIALIAIIFISAFLLKPSFSGDMSIPGTPSEEANALLQEEFPSGSDAGSLRIVFGAEGNEKLTSESSQQAISDVLDKIMEDDQVASAANPFKAQTVSADGAVAYADITYKEAAADVPESSLEHAEKSIEIAKNEGLQVAMKGDIIPSEVEIGGISEVIGIVMAFIVLSITFASFVIAGLPILNALLGLVASIGVTLIGASMFDITSFSLSLSVMIGLAVGIDYALFIFSKHRQQVRDGIEINESIARANGTAGGAVIFAGLTVIVALCGLTVIGIPFLAAMGITAALSVLFAVLVSITAGPAVLALVGKRIDKKNRLLSKSSKNQKGQTDSNAWGRFVTKQPLIVTIISIVILVIISIPATDLRLGLPDDGMKAEDDPARQAYDLLADGFGEGFNGPLAVLVDASGTSGDQTVQFQKATEEIGKLDNVSQVTPAMPNESGKYAIVNVIPETGPNDSGTADLVHDIRKLSLNDGGENIEFRVTGLTAINIDIAEKLNDAIPIFGVIIVGFAFILLMIVFRSLLVPLTAVAGFLLTMTATLGFSVFILQDGYLNSLLGIPQEGPILAFLPILVIGILFGLAMDYQVFLVSRMHEEYTITKDPVRSILAGLKYSGPVVTAAGLIMIFVFAGFIFAGDTMIKSMGLALTFGVLFDAFIVRLALIPAIMKLMGHATWYLPKWLDKIIPNVDIEGHKLSEKLSEQNENVSAQGNKLKTY
ncbi:MMPL family transporter [Terribacillus saccharophilus]|uniref:MMPL family transporter n=1 Tax=Terribacillus saccharophilus TaxID=361277 RepID=UPI002DC39A41|nr:MMPL family transporter [Terribacillus saccharophilus]MEC0289488.1 MMPL family transporter [Terribacillus saccharophilus]